VTGRHFEDHRAGYCHMPYLQNNSLDWALQHVLRYGDTDVFPVPFE